VCTRNNINLTYAEQNDLITQGLAILRDSAESIPVLFVPPAHVADTTTYRVLLDHQFSNISTTGPGYGFLFEELYNFAPNKEFTWQLAASAYNSSLASALLEIRSKFATDGYYCLLFHDFFIRQGYGDGIVIRWVGELLDSLDAEYGENIEYLTISETIARYRPVSVSAPATAGTMAFKLFAYPNPISDKARIFYTVAEAGAVVMDVFNLNGQLVSRILPGAFLNAGRYQTEWRVPPALGSGVYLCRMAQGGCFQTCKLAIVR